MSPHIFSNKWIPVALCACILAVWTEIATASDYQLTITVSPSEAGKVFKHGTVIEDGKFTHYDIEALASSGWTFANWSGDLSGTDNPLSILLDRDINAICNFIKKPYMPPVTWSIGKIADSAAYGTNINCSANKAAWQRMEAEYPLTELSYIPLSRILVWDGILIQLVSSDGEYAHSPSLDNGNIAWASFDGTDYEISFKEGLSPAINLTNNSLLDRRPSLHGYRIAFETMSGWEWNIRYWVDASIYEITRAGRDNNPSVHDNRIAWQGFDGTDYEIFLWDGLQIIQITDNQTDDVNPSLYDGKIAWENMGNILFYDGNTTISVTSDNLCYSKPSLCAGSIAFEGFDGNEREIFFWDGQRLDPVTQDNKDDMEPALSYVDGKWTLAWRKEQDVWFGTLNVARICSLQKSVDESVILTWRSIEGGTYSVYFSDDEYSNSMTWSLAQDNISSAGNLTEWVDDGTNTGTPPAQASHRYYKILTN